MSSELRAPVLGLCFFVSVNPMLQFVLIILKKWVELIKKLKIESPRSVSGARLPATYRRGEPELHTRDEHDEACEGKPKASEKKQCRVNCVRQC